MRILGKTSLNGVVRLYKLMKIFIAISLFVLLVLLIQNKYKASVLFTGLSCIYFILDLISFQNFVNSYTNISLLTLVLLLLISVVLEKTSLIDFFSKTIIKKSYSSTFLRLGFITALFSAFLNNSAVVASLMYPIKKNKYHPPSKLLIPLSYFAILGGTMTLIGTSTNLLINSFLIDNGHSGFKIFDFFLMGSILTCVGIIVMFVFRKLLPNYDCEKVDINKYIVELKVSANSNLINKPLKKSGLLNLEYFLLIKVIRNEEEITSFTGNETIYEDDKLLFSGDIKRLHLLIKFNGLVLVDNCEVDKLNLIDVIVSPESSLINKKIKDINFKSKFDASIVSIKRGNESISKITEEVLYSGDRLVFAVGSDFYNRSSISKNFYLLSNISQNKKLSNKSSFIILLGFFIVVFSSALGFISLFKSLLIYLLVLILLKVEKLENLKKRFPYHIFMTIGSSLVISKVLIAQGLANDLSSIVTSTFGQFGVIGSFVGIYLITLILTEIITNNAAAALTFPIAYTTAVGLDANVIPFVFAVVYGASASFLSPYGYQTNLMVSSFGGYKVKDFFKIGWVITLVYSLIVIIFIPYFYKLA